MKVENILSVKGSAVVTIGPSETVEALSQRLREKRIGALVVSSDGLTVEGIVSERDVAYALSVHQGDLRALPVSAIMTKSVITCSPSDSIAQVAAAMLARNIRHLPVEEGKRLFGIVSFRDVLNVRLDEIQRETKLLLALASETNHETQDR